jgi:hypothetical protein
MRWFITDNACGILRRFLRRHGGHRTWNSWCIFALLLLFKTEWYELGTSFTSRNILSSFTTYSFAVCDESFRVLIVAKCCLFRFGLS